MHKLFEEKTLLKISNSNEMSSVIKSIRIEVKKI